MRVVKGGEGLNIKRWEVSKLDKGRAARTAEKYEIPSFLAMLLEIRGLTDRAGEILYDDVPLSDPFLMKDMDKAVERIRRAIDNFERIAVYGDYDADGVTSTAMLYTYLEARGADVLYYIPQREGEGYGMNAGAVEHLNTQGVKLIITVDNGISSVAEVELASKLGMDVVVTDHHRPQEQLPAAAAVVDAYQAEDQSPFSDFSGAGVALKLLIALEEGDEEAVLEEYADLAALGTVGDVVPILGENRTIVKAGLALLARGGRPGIEALLQNCSVSGQDLTANSLSFTLIPRINATGRMGAPERAVRLLTCDYEEEAAQMAQEICEDNEERRRVEAEVAREAIERVEQDPTMAFEPVIVVSGQGWHHGVIGIVASRVTGRFGKPCFVISIDGGQAKGSGRSVEGFSLFQAVCACEELLEKFGGHPMAAGINLKAENVPLFREKINAYAKKEFPEMPPQVVTLDCKLNPASLSTQMPAQLQRLEPFGSGNPTPLFGLYGMELREVVPVGGGNHLRLSLCREGASVTCMRFGVKPEEFPFSPGEVLDLAVSLELREYRGEPQLSIQAKEIKLSALDAGLSIHSYRVYEKYRCREKIEQQEARILAPTREDLAALYRRLAAQKGVPAGLQSLLGALGGRFNLGKLLLCLEALEERGLIRYKITEELCGAEILPAGEKVDVFASKVFETMRTLICEKGESL